MPGDYTVTLTCDGNALTQSFAVKMDPRVKIPDAGLQRQHDLSLQCYEGRMKCREIINDIKTDESQPKPKMADPTLADGFSRLNNTFGNLLNLLQESDRPPTDQAVAAIADTQKQFEQLMAKWNSLKGK
jgi:hypothetical protein